ncbi:MAG TPA: dCMP deaminase family protein [Candidatus Gastranaerophilales bacterium]|nr:dCMP deaminase family protein [Candidatus Gastranaerophilales bacterium]
MRPSFEEYFMGLAKQSAIRSNCIRAQVGAVIVDVNNKIKSTGYNGAPSGVISCLEKGSCYRIQNKIPSGTQYETCQSLHAEMNAIIQAGEGICRDGSIYVYGHNQVCIMCKRFIVQAGIKNIYLQKNDSEPIFEYKADDFICEFNEIQKL